MFFKTAKAQNKFLEVDLQQFALLKKLSNIDDSKFTYDFNFRYKLPIKPTILNNAFKVKIKVFSNLVPQNDIKSKISSLEGDSQYKALIEQIQKQTININEQYKKQNDYLLCSKNSDVTKQINLSIVNDILTKDLSEINELNFKQLVVTNQYDLSIDANIISSLIVKNDNEINKNDVKKSMLNMILYDGLDPSYIVAMPHDSITTQQSIDGSIKPQRTNAKSISYKNANFLYDSIIHDNQQNVQNDEFVQTFETVTQTYYSLNENVTFEHDDSNVVVQFELFNIKTNQLLQTLIVPLNIHQHIVNYYTPLKPPIVKISSTNSLARAKLEITRGDDKTVKLLVLQKKIYATSPLIDEYHLFTTFNVNSKTKKIEVDVPINSSYIYRIIPVGKLNISGNEYTNIVLKSNKIFEIQNTSVTTRIVDTGIQIEARNFSQNVCAIQFLVKNKTTHESEWSNLGSAIQVLPTTVHDDLLYMIDSNVKHQRIYEYAVKLIFKNGSTSIVGNSIIEFIKPEIGIIDTTITNLQIDKSNDLNVLFNIETQLLDTDVDIVKDLLTINSIEEYFKNDVEKEKTLFKKLLAYYIIRTNITTGEQESFNVIVGNSFNDEQYRKQNAVKNLQLNCEYRYEIFPLLRSPETLLESYSKDVVDTATLKPYKYSPSKFHHPITLTRGLLLSTKGRQLLYGKNEIMYGIIGNSQTVDVSFTNESVSITDLSVERIDQNTNKIRWKLNSDISQIDHFLILKNVNGIKTFVGKVHSNFKQDIYFVHKLQKNDFGTFKYEIIPVLNSYQMSQIESTQNVKVEF